MTVIILWFSYFVCTLKLVSHYLPLSCRLVSHIIILSLTHPIVLFSFFFWSGLGFFETKKILIYSSETDDSNIDTLKNIHESWGNCDLIMTTPSITVGNSYKPEIIDFDNIFCFGTPTCIIADTYIWSIILS